MEDVLSHLDQIKENILEQKNDIKEQSKYFEYNLFNIDDNNRNKRSLYNYQKILILSRPSMINISKNIKSINMSPKHYLLEESSDNEDGYNEETKQSFPSLMKVAKNMFDPNVFMILTDIKYFPKEAQPGLIISGIEDWVTEKHLKIFLKEVPSFKDKHKPDKNNKNKENADLCINSIKFFIEQNKRYAYIKLNSYNQMEIIGNFFLNPIKKIYPSYNSKKEKIEVYFAYNLLNLTKNHWYGVILRNLPPNCNDKSIYDFSDQKVKNGIKYCLNPIIIDNIFCSLVVCKELEYAEKLCHCLNNKDIGNNKYIKAHLHPNICKIRNENFYNNYETFSKEGYLFNINAEQSEKCLAFAKPFMEFFYPDYLESFNNSNKSKKKEKEIKNFNDNNENNKINKDKEKNIKREKDLTLASSILDLIKKTNSQNIKEKHIINNGNIEENISKNKTDEIQSSKSLPNKNNIKSTIIPEQNSQSNLDIIKINSQPLSTNTNENFNESKINNENKTLFDANKEKDNIKNMNNNLNKEIKENNPIKYSQEEINYYTYNMGDQKYYEDLENQHQRKTSSYQQRNNNYKDDYKNYYKSNNYNREYKSQRYEHKNNIPSPHRQYNTSYKKQNLGYQKSNKDREYNNSRNYDNYKERSREKDKERSRDRNDDEWKNFRDDKDKRYNNNYYNNDKRKDREREREREWERDKEKYKERDKGWNRDKEREKDREKDRDKERDRDKEKDWDKDRQRNRDRDRDRQWDKDREKNRERDKDREKDKERFSDDRNRRYNDYRYYERNNNNERRKGSWHSNSRQNNDRERKDKYFNNK